MRPFRGLFAQILRAFIDFAPKSATFDLSGQLASPGSKRALGPPSQLRLPPGLRPPIQAAYLPYDPPGCAKNPRLASPGPFRNKILNGVPAGA